MKVIKRVLLVLLSIFALLLAWSLAEPYVIEEETLSVPLANLPEAWEGERIVVLADFQVGMWWGNTWTIERIVNRITEDQPGAVLIAGDFVYHPGTSESNESRKAAELLRPLVDAGVPVYAVLGNHDYGMPTAKAQKDEALAEDVRTALEGVGVRVLQNEAAALEPPNGSASSPLYLVGIGPHIADESDPEAALSQLPEDAPRLALMHHPASFTQFPAGTAPLAFGAHTHGGQLSLPFTPDWSYMALIEEDTVHADGWVNNYGAANNRLYINRGIGFSVIPMRLNAAPELTLVTLERGTN